MSDPYARQEGGAHYQRAPIQRFQFTLQNGWDSAADNILKYVVRHEAKNGREDLAKALHVVDIREIEIIRRDTNLDRPTLPWRSDAPTMDDFIRENGIRGDEAEALLALNAWVRYGHTTLRADRVRQTIRRLLALYYPTPRKDQA